MEALAQQQRQKQQEEQHDPAEPQPREGKGLSDASRAQHGASAASAAAAALGAALLQRVREHHNRSSKQATGDADPKLPDPDPLVGPPPIKVEGRGHPLRPQKVGSQGTGQTPEPQGPGTVAADAAEGSATAAPPAANSSGGDEETETASLDEQERHAGPTQQQQPRGVQPDDGAGGQEAKGPRADEGGGAEGLKGAALEGEAGANLSPEQLLQLSGLDPHTVLLLQQKGLLARPGSSSGKLQGQQQPQPQQEQQQEQDTNRAGKAPVVEARAGVRGGRRAAAREEEDEEDDGEEGDDGDEEGEEDGRGGGNGSRGGTRGRGEAVDDANMPPSVQVTVATRQSLPRPGGGPPVVEYVAGPVTGTFFPSRYMARRDCIMYGGSYISRSRFERLGRSASAKWYRSIRVLPDLEPLGEWLDRHGLPVLKGANRISARRRQVVGSRSGTAAAPPSDGETPPAARDAMAADPYLAAAARAQQLAAGLVQVGAPAAAAAPGLTGALLDPVLAAAAAAGVGGAGGGSGSGGGLGVGDLLIQQALAQSISQRSQALLLQAQSSARAAAAAAAAGLDPATTVPISPAAAAAGALPPTAVSMWAQPPPQRQSAGQASLSAGGAPLQTVYLPQRASVSSLPRHSGAVGLTAAGPSGQLLAVPGHHSLPLTLSMPVLPAAASAGSAPPSARSGRPGTGPVTPLAGTVLGSASGFNLQDALAASAHPDSPSDGQAGPAALLATPLVQQLLARAAAANAGTARAGEERHSAHLRSHSSGGLTEASPARPGSSGKQGQKGQGLTEVASRLRRPVIASVSKPIEGGSGRRAGESDGGGRRLTEDADAADAAAALAQLATAAAAAGSEEAHPDDSVPQTLTQSVPGPPPQQQRAKASQQLVSADDHMVEGNSRGRSGRAQGPRSPARSVGGGPADAQREQEPSAGAPQPGAQAEARGKGATTVPVQAARGGSGGSGGSGEGGASGAACERLHGGTGGGAAGGGAEGSAESSRKRAHPHGTGPASDRGSGGGSAAGTPVRRAGGGQPHLEDVPGGPGPVAAAAVEGRRGPPGEGGHPHEPSGHAEEEHAVSGYDSRGEERQQQRAHKMQRPSPYGARAGGVQPPHGAHRAVWMEGPDGIPRLVSAHLPHGGGHVPHGVAPYLAHGDPHMMVAVGPNGEEYEYVYATDAELDSMDHGGTPLPPQLAAARRARPGAGGGVSAGTPPPQPPLQASAAIVVTPHGLQLQLPVQLAGGPGGSASAVVHMMLPEGSVNPDGTVTLNISDLLAAAQQGAVAAAQAAVRRPALGPPGQPGRGPLGGHGVMELQAAAATGPAAARGPHPSGMVYVGRSPYAGAAGGLHRAVRHGDEAGGMGGEDEDEDPYIRMPEETRLQGRGAGSAAAQGGRTMLAAASGEREPEVAGAGAREDGGGGGGREAVSAGGPRGGVPAARPPGEGQWQQQRPGGGVQRQLLPHMLPRGPRYVDVNGNELVVGPDGVLGVAGWPGEHLLAGHGAPRHGHPPPQPPPYGMSMRPGYVMPYQVPYGSAVRMMAQGEVVVQGGGHAGYGVARPGGKGPVHMVVMPRGAGGGGGGGVEPQYGRMSAGHYGSGSGSGLRQGAPLTREVVMTEYEE